MIFRRLRRILAAENADYTSIAYFPALFKSEFRRKSESDHRYTKKAAQSENCTAFLKNLWCGRQDLNLHAEAIEPKSIVSASFTTSAGNVFSIPRFSGFVKHVHQFFSEMTPTKQTSQPDKRTKNQRNYVHFTLSVAIAAARQTGSKPPFSEEAIMKIDFHVRATRRLDDFPNSCYNSTILKIWRNVTCES